MGRLLPLVGALTMHAFHDHLARQIADKLKCRRIVVWYDDRCEFVDFIEELSLGAVTPEPVHPVRVGGLDATLARPLPGHHPEPPRARPRRRDAPVAASEYRVSEQCPA